MNAYAPPISDTAPLPANLEAEAALLGAVLIHNEILDVLTTPLSPEHFHEPVHARIFERILALRASGAKSVTPVTLKPYFEFDEPLKELGGPAYLVRLTSDGQGLLAPQSLAEQIAELALRRRRIEQAMLVSATARDLDIPVDEIPVFEVEHREGRRGLPVIDMSGWGAPAPARRSAWGDWLPLLKTTMLTGEGGVGKSLFAQMLLTCTALGRPFLGQDTTSAPSLYLTAEDDPEELWRRQRAICSTLGVEISDLEGRLTLVSLDGEPDTAFVRFDAERRMTITSRFREVEQFAQRNGIRYFAFDNATDLMGGDHNDVHEVAGFVNLLTGLAIQQDGASLLLHHPNKGGDDWLGSVAWHNKVRSRLIIKRAENNDPDARTVENPKANYGPSGTKVPFRWHRGAFIRDEDLSPSLRSELDEVVAATGANAAFLDCLRVRAKQGIDRAVGPSPSANYAPSQFEGTPEAKGYSKADLRAAMNRLYSLGQIRTEVVDRPGKSETKSIIVEVE